MIMVEEHDFSTLTGSEGYNTLCSLPDVTDYFNADLSSEELNIGWVFWRAKRDQHSDFDSVEQKIKNVLINVGSDLYWGEHFIFQFWAAKVEGKHHYLTTSDQPFCLGSLAEGLCWYRKLCMDAPKHHQLLGPVGRVYWNKRPESSPDLRLYSTTEFPLRDEAARCGLRNYLAIPVFDMRGYGEFHGVLELISSHSLICKYLFLSRRLEQVAMLRSTHLYHQPPKQPENEITEMLKFAITAVPQLHLAQVWIPCKQCDDTRRNFKCMERTDYLYNWCYDMYEYLEACEFHNLQIEKEITGCFHKKICDTSILANPFAHYQQKARLSLYFRIPLVSVHNCNDISVVEFFLHPNHREYACGDSLMLLLLRIMKMELKSFKFSLGGQLAEKLAIESGQPNLIEHGYSELNMLKEMLKEMEPYYGSYSGSDFIERFQLTDLNSIRPSRDHNGWAFYSPDKEESSVNDINSQSSHMPNLIKRKVEVLMSEIASKMYLDSYVLVQFWAPNMEKGRLYLATSEQPYALVRLCKGSVRFRKHCMDHRYFVDEKAKEEELGPPGRVFRNGYPEISNDVRLYSLRDFPLRNHAACCAFRFYLALPVFDLGHHICVGVLEVLSDRDTLAKNYVASMSDCLKTANLGSTHIISQPGSLASHLPHNVVICRKQALAEFEEAFQLINNIPQLCLAEVWMPYGESASINSNLSCMELVFANRRWSGPRRLVPHVQTKTGITEMVLASENKCCFCQHSCDFRIAGQHFQQVHRLDACFAICLHSSLTGDLPYVVEFSLNHGPTTHEYLKSFLKFLLPIMKQKLKSFKVASGKPLGEELVVEVICFSDTDKLTFPDLHWQADSFSVKFKLVHFDQKNHQHAEYISDDIESVESGPQTREFSNTSDNLEKEAETKKTERGKGKTSLHLNDMAEELCAGISTIKHGIPHLPNNKKYKENPSLITDEKGSEIAYGSLQNTQSSSSCNHPGPDMPLQQYVPQKNINSGSTQNLNNQAEAEQVTVKVKYKKDNIRFMIHLSSGIEKIVKEVARRLHLEKGSFKLKYVDDDNHKILLACDDDLQFCPTSVAAAGKAYIQLFVELNR